MEFVERADDRPEQIAIARCRELLGAETDAWTDQEIALIRQHAETMACMVVEMYMDHCSRSGRRGRQRYATRSPRLSERRR
jgi:hypothetical protein